MFKIQHLSTKQVFDVFGTRVDRQTWFLICVSEDRWKWVLSDNYKPYNPITDKFKVGFKYEYPCGFNNTDYVQIKSIKGEYACVHSQILNDEIIVELGDLKGDGFQ